jgi:hypothetical protein
MVFKQKHTPKTSQFFALTTVPRAIRNHPSLMTFDTSGIINYKPKKTFIAKITKVRKLA